MKIQKEKQLAIEEEKKFCMKERDEGRAAIEKLKEKMAIMNVDHANRIENMSSDKQVIFV